MKQHERPHDGPAGRADVCRPLVKTLVRALAEKKGNRIQVLDVGELVSYADFLVLVGGQSTAQVQALVDSVENAVKGTWRPTYVNRSPDHSWWIIDFVDVVVHVFKGEARESYDLEGLWADAPDGMESLGLEGISSSE